MQIQFGEISRGSDKIYIHVTTTDEPRDTSFHVRARTAAGDAVPARIMSMPEVAGYVVVLAVLSVVQEVRVDARDTGGRVLATGIRSVAPFEARLRSQFNTATKNDVALAIRNADIKYQQSGISLTIDSVINCEDETDIVHGVANIMTADAEARTCQPGFRFLGSDGHPCELAPWIYMSNLVEESHDYPGFWQRRIAFSVRIAHTQPTLTIWASLPGASVADSFICLGAEPLEHLRQDWALATTSADTDPRYESWFLRRQRVSTDELAAQRTKHFGIEPLFSIVVPLYKTPLSFFHEMVQSVLAQSYGNFELILINASPESVELCQAAELYSNQDKRIKVVTLEKNLGIAGNTRAGEAEATGDFICYFDHDDIIEPDLLFHYVKGINDYPETDLLYCDEDKLENGHFNRAFFKPDWNPDFLLSNNYVCHLLCVRRSIVEQLPNDGDAYEGAQDYNLTLFASEHARNIYHVRKILYHWRIHQGSTANDPTAKSYTTESGRRAIEAHLARRGLTAAVDYAELPNTFHVVYPLPERPTRVSMVIPNKDMPDVLTRLIRSIQEKTTYTNYEIIIVENNSVMSETFALYDELQKDDRIRVLTYRQTGEFNFSSLMNFGFAHATGELFLSLNNDLEVISSDWLGSLVRQAVRPEIGAVGCKLMFPDGLVQHAGVIFNRGEPQHIYYMKPASKQSYYNMSLVRDFSAVTAACMMVRREVFEALGGFSEDFPSNYNDLDFCLRVREMGLRVLYEPNCELYHYESLSRGLQISPSKMAQHIDDRILLMQRYLKFFIEGDPMLNPNLTDDPWCVLD